MRSRHDAGAKIRKFMVYFIGFIMIGSVFGVVFFGFGSDVTSTSKYNGFKFVNKGSFWSTTVNGREALFTYLPKDVEQILFDNGAADKIRNVFQIDTTSDFNDTLAQPIALAQFQMGVTLNNFGVFVRNGFTDNRSNFPVLSCEAATKFVPVIYFKSSNTTNVHLEENCIVAEALDGADALRIKDRLVYERLGIIKQQKD